MAKRRRRKLKTVADILKQKKGRIKKCASRTGFAELG
jgi:hypothetical protein